MKNLNLLSRILYLMLFLSVSACSTAPTAPKERFFWPLAPEVPRIEWINTYYGTTGLKNPGLLSLLAGEDDLNLIGPVFAAADSKGKIYVTDQVLHAVVVINIKAADAHILGGSDGAGMFKTVTGIDIDANGNIYVADSELKKVFVFDKDEKQTEVLDFSSNVTSIASIAIDRKLSRLYLPDVRGHKIVVSDLKGSVLNSFGKKGGKDLEFQYPTSVAIESDGTLVICDAQNARIQRIKPDGTFINAFGNRGDGVGQFNIIKAAAVDSEGHIYVTDGKGNKFTIFNSTGETLISIGGTYAARAGASIGPGGFLIPNGIYIDGNDTIYIVDSMNKRVQVFQYLNEKYLLEHPVEIKQEEKKEIKLEEKKTVK